MARNENPGCLGSLLALFGIGPREEPELPYRLRDDFLSPAESAFYRSLVSGVGQQLAVCPKVNLADVFFVIQPNENQAHRNRIDRKHVDFLLCDPTSMRPLLGVELDDASHQRADRQTRDELVDAVFKVAGLPLLRERARAGYDVAELSARVFACLQVPAPAVVSPVAEVSASAAPSPASTTPACPKCGVPMVMRTASRGGRQGERFWGCPNYPKCRETQPCSNGGPTA